MARIYGQSGAEKNLLRECSPRISNFEEIKATITKLHDKLEQERNSFFDNLPKLIVNEKITLENLKSKEKEIEESWDEKIEHTRKTVNKNKLKFWLYVDLFIKTKFSKPKEIKIARKDIEEQNKLVRLLENNPDEVFQREQIELTCEINQLERASKSPDYSGAYGEIKTLSELKKLNDDFHVFCDVSITLRNYVRYKGNRNLKSAQMDFVVVGSTGIFVIEVKNWSSDYLRNYYGISPHEQIDRAGLVLWIYLKNHTYFLNPRITKLLVPIQHNLRYNPNYKYVLIRDVPNIGRFVSNNKNILSDSKVNKIVSLLSR